MQAQELIDATDRGHLQQLEEARTRRCENGQEQRGEEAAGGGRGATEDESSVANVLCNFDQKCRAS